MNVVDLFDSLDKIFRTIINLSIFKRNRSYEKSYGLHFTGSIICGELFFGELTRVETSYSFISAFG